MTRIFVEPAWTDPGATVAPYQEAGSTNNDRFGGHDNENNPFIYAIMRWLELRSKRLSTYRICRLTDRFALSRPTRESFRTYCPKKCQHFRRRAFRMRLCRRYGVRFATAIEPSPRQPHRPSLRLLLHVHPIHNRITRRITCHQLLHHRADQTHVIHIQRHLQRTQLGF